jgi:hypothetical protein
MFNSRIGKSGWRAGIELEYASYEAVRLFTESHFINRSITVFFRFCGNDFPLLWQ